MARGRGRARDTNTSFWEIVGPSGARLCVFDHDRFSNIMDGARVQYADDDGDGIAEHVRSVAEVDRLVALSAANGRRFGRGARQVLSHHVLVSLSARGERSEEVEIRIADIRSGAGAADSKIDLALLRRHGIED